MGGGRSRDRALETFGDICQLLSELTFELTFENPPAVEATQTVKTVAGPVGLEGAYQRAATDHLLSYHPVLRINKRGIVAGDMT